MFAFGARVGGGGGAGREASPPLSLLWGMKGGVCLVAAEAHELDVLISRDRNVNMEPTGGCDGLSSPSETEGLEEV